MFSLSELSSSPDDPPKVKTVDFLFACAGACIRLSKELASLKESSPD